MKKKQWLKSGKREHSAYYLNAVATFDIEVSSFEDAGEKRSVVYSWAVCWEGTTMVFRTREDFIAYVGNIVEKYKTGKKKRVIFWVHNLSYEYQFIKRLFSWEDVFSVNSERKILYARTCDGIEFRCSYMLTQSSLLNLTRGTVWEKKAGDLDYSKTRTPLTPLTSEEIGYIETDVLGLYHCIKREVSKVGTLVDLPLTKTGYVRSYCREHMTEEDRDTVSALTVTPDEFAKLREAFSGGYVHGNADYCDKVLKNVSSFDFSSSYPARMVEGCYPMSSGRPVEISSLEELDEYAEGFCCLVTVKLWGLRCLVPSTFISLSKAKEHGEIWGVDNGRIYSAEWVTLTLTDVDFALIRQMYKIDRIDVLGCYVYEAGHLPASFLRCVLDFYNKKTTLKGVPGNEDDYQISKGMLNSLYGMCVTNPIHPEYEECCGDLREVEATKSDALRLIDRENENSRRFLFYPWGVWITAYARAALMETILQLGGDWVYSDTDSIKVLNADRYRETIERANKRITGRLVASCQVCGLPVEYLSPADISGKQHPLGVFEYEGTYTRFKTMGAKRYLYEKDGHIFLTNSGVNKERGGQFLEDTGDPFGFYTNHLVIPAEYAGHTVSYYIDHRTAGEVVDYLGNRYKYDEPSGLHITQADYHMDLSAVYLAFQQKK